MKKTNRPRGSITKFGYRRIQMKDRKQKFEHVLVWEDHFGPVQEGKELHHINGDKLDNRIENLHAVTRLEHKWIESGCFLVAGKWLKRCRRCRWLRPIDSDFYVYPGRNGVMGVCKRCASDLAVEAKRKRRAQRKKLPHSDR